MAGPAARFARQLEDQCGGIAGKSDVYLPLGFFCQNKAQMEYEGRRMVLDILLDLAKDFYCHRRFLSCIKAAYGDKLPLNV